MIVNELTKRVLTIRKDRRDLEKLGYRRHETDWEIHRGGRYMDVIIDKGLG
jgi:hypothetical protein